MSPRKDKRDKTKKGKEKEVRSRREKRAGKKARPGEQVAALTARVEALEARVAALESASAPQPPVDPLTMISGVGPRYAERLRAAGIGGVTDLVEANPEVLAEQTGIPSKVIQGWIDVASVA